MMVVMMVMDMVIAVVIQVVLGCYCRAVTDDRIWHFVIVLKLWCMVMAIAVRLGT